MSTFLQLTNFVIREAGIEDEPLTSVTFATAEAISPIYGKIKHWVNQAWMDIQQERDNYTWQTGQAVVLLRPRIRFYDAIDLGGGTWTGNAVSSETDVQLAFAAPIYFAGSTTQGYADIIGSPTTADTLGDDNTLSQALRMGENIFFPDSETPDSSYRFFGWGEYNFIDQDEPLDSPITDVADVHHNTVRILSDNSSDTNGFPLVYIPYHDWQLGHPFYQDTPSAPIAYTQNIQGKFIFNGPLDKPYRLKFSYTKNPQELVLHGDIPQGLRPEFHNSIGWRALEKYGEYDGRLASVAQRARRELLKMKNHQEKRDLPQMFLNTESIRW